MPTHSAVRVSKRERESRTELFRFSMYIRDFSSNFADEARVCCYCCWSFSSFRQARGWLVSASPPREIGFVRLCIYILSEYRHPLLCPKAQLLIISVAEMKFLELAVSLLFSIFSFLRAACLPGDCGRWSSMMMRKIHGYARLMR